MTDLTGHAVDVPARDDALPEASVHTTDAARRRLAKRYAAERRFKALGLGAVLLAASFLVVLLADIVWKGLPAFTYHYVELPVDLSGDAIDADDPAKSNFDRIVKNAMDALLPFAEGRTARRAARGILSPGAPINLRQAVIDDPDLIGAERRTALPVDDEIDLYLQGGRVAMERLEASGTMTPDGADGDVELIADAETFAPIHAAFTAVPENAGSRRLTSDDPSFLLHLNGGIVKLSEVEGRRASGVVLKPLRTTGPAEDGSWRLVRVDPPESVRKISDREIVYVEELRDLGLIENRLNWLFFTKGASREPGQAGVWGAVVGSFLTLVVTLAVSFPLGVAAAIYLEEFAPKNRLTDLIEVNINNLAAVPSIVFGLLGLAVFLNFFGMPRSAPVVGGLVLALMTLPTIIIASRAALKAVPPSIREAALGVGASRLQTVFHHVLPLALPGMMTGTIIGMAQALGETAPLLMIGMVAFIVDVPGGFFDPSTVLPVQIYMWADFPEPAFQQKTAAAIMVLLAFLVLMNALAVLLRRRFERRW